MQEQGKSHIILQGDAWELAKRMPSRSVQCIVTSPPYWSLRDYGTAQWDGGNPDCDHAIGRIMGNANKGAVRTVLDTDISSCSKCGATRVDSQFGLEKSPQEYVDKLVALFRELRRVLRDDGTLWINLGDSYNGSGGAGGDYNAGGLKEGQPKYPGRNVENLKPKDLVGIPWRVAFALQDDGWYLRSDIVWHKPNPMPESVTDRPTKAHEYIFLLSKSQRYFYDAEAIKEPLAGASAARYAYSFGGEKNEHLKATDKPTAIVGDREPTNGRNKRTVWTVNTKPYKGAHFATFPPALITPCILAGTSEVGNCPECGNPWKRVIQKPDMSDRPIRSSGSKMETDEVHISNGWAGTPKSAGQAYQEWRNENPNVTLGWKPTCECGKSPVPAVVLDPFCGSGTTLAVALQHGRHAVGFELNPEYIELAEKRIVDETQQAVEVPPLEVQLNDLPLFEERN